MNPATLIPKKWYWVQKSNGTIVPYRLNRVIPNEDNRSGCSVEMFVGSMVQTFSASQIVGEAVSSESDSVQRKMPRNE